MVAIPSTSATTADPSISDQHTDPLLQQSPPLADSTNLPGPAVLPQQQFPTPQQYYGAPPPYEPKQGGGHQYVINSTESSCPQYKPPYMYPQDFSNFPPPPSYTACSNGPGVSLPPPQQLGINQIHFYGYHQSSSIPPHLQPHIYTPQNNGEMPYGDIPSFTTQVTYPAQMQLTPQQMVRRRAVQYMAAFVFVTTFVWIITRFLF